MQESDLQENIEKITENLKTISNNTLSFLEQDIQNYFLEEDIQNHALDDKIKKIRENLVIKNNIHLYNDMKSLEFLRDIGKHFRVSTM